MQRRPSPPQRRFLIAAVLGILLAGCAGEQRAEPAADPRSDAGGPTRQEQAVAVALPRAAGFDQPAPPAPSPALPLDEAVAVAANKLLSDALAPASPLIPAPRHLLLIDPLVDGLSGIQSQATQSIQAQIVEIVETRFPQFDIQPFTAANVARSPLVLIGTLTGVDRDGVVGTLRSSYRIWLTLLDLDSGVIVAKARANALPEAVDLTPLPAFRDSPSWTTDAAVRSYIDTCQRSKVGDPIPPGYFDAILASVLITEAIEAYGAGRYREALDLYASAQTLPAGDQLRVYNGIYLCNAKLGREEEAAAAFGDLVDYGLRNQAIALKFLFRPGSTVFWPDPRISGPYEMWLQQIAEHAVRRQACLEVIGHSSPSGPEPLNERLSLLRAEYIARRLEDEAPALGRRIITRGAGSRENIVGTGSDDVVDALDRRVEFQVPGC